MFILVCFFSLVWNYTLSKGKKLNLKTDQKVKKKHKKKTMPVVAERKKQFCHDSFLRV